MKNKLRKHDTRTIKLTHSPNYTCHKLGWKVSRKERNPEREREREKDLGLEREREREGEREIQRRERERERERERKEINRRH